MRRLRQDDQRAVRLHFDLTFTLNGRRYISSVTSNPIFNGTARVPLCRGAPRVLAPNPLTLTPPQRACARHPLRSATAHQEALAGLRLRVQQHGGDYSVLQGARQHPHPHPRLQPHRLWQPRRRRGRPAGNVQRLDTHRERLLGDCPVQLWCGRPAASPLPAALRSAALHGPGADRRAVVAPLVAAGLLRQGSITSSPSSSTSRRTTRRASPTPSRS